MRLEASKNKESSLNEILLALIKKKCMEDFLRNNLSLSKLV